MEVVLLVLGITGIALLAMFRVIQRRSSSARHRHARPPGARRGEAPAHVVAAAAPRRRDVDAESARRRERLGRRPRLGGRGDAQAARRGSSGARASRRNAPAEPVQEAPSAEPWQSDEDWLEEDDGLGWEGAGVAGNGNGNGPVDPSSWTSGREWTTRESGPSPEAGGRRRLGVRRDRRRRGAAHLRARRHRVGRRAGGAPLGRADAAACSVPEERRKLHPVAAAGDLRRGGHRPRRAGQHRAARRVRPGPEQSDHARARRPRPCGRPSRRLRPPAASPTTRRRSPRRVPRRPRRVRRRPGSGGSSGARARARWPPATTPWRPRGARRAPDARGP